MFWNILERSTEKKNSDSLITLMSQESNVFFWNIANLFKTDLEHY